MIKKIGHLFVILFCAFGFFNNAKADINAAKRSVPRIALIGFDETGQGFMSTGSGFAIGKNLVITNYHVISQYDILSQPIILSIGPNGEAKRLKAQIKAFDKQADIALLYVPEGNYVPLPLSLSRADSEIGVYALGYPGVVDDVYQRQTDQILSPSRPEAFEGTVSNYVNQSPNGEKVETINHSAQISGGNSGGPLVDECGRVIGVNTWRDTQNGTYSFAISAKIVANFLKSNGVSVPIIEDKCISAGQKATAEAEIAQEKLHQLITDSETTKQSIIANQQEIESTKQNLKSQIEILKIIIFAICAILIATLGFVFFMALKPKAITNSKTPITMFAILVFAAIFGGAGFVIWKTKFQKQDNSNSVKISNEIAQEITGAQPNSNDKQMEIAPNANDKSSANDDDTLLKDANLGAKYSCNFDNNASQKFQTDTSSFENTLNFRLSQNTSCLMGRTQYIESNSKLVRLRPSDKERALFVSIFDPKTNTYSQKRIALDSERFDKLKSMTDKIPRKTCGAQIKTQEAAVYKEFASEINSNAIENFVWRCKPAQ